MAEAHLDALFQASMSPDKNTRIAAELELRKFESSEGMLSAVLGLIIHSSTEIGVQQAAAIYLKNRVRKAWALDSSSRIAVAPIPASDKQYLKSNLLPTLIASHPIIKAQLKEALANIVVEEFPEQWPDLLPTILTGITSNQEAHIEGSLIALYQMYKKYRYLQVDRSVPDSISKQVLPILVTLGSHALQTAPPPQSPESVACLLHLIFKVYRLSAASDLSIHHQDIQESLVPWGTLFLQVVNRQLDPNALPQDADGRERCEWWKAKKWAYNNLNKLFVRYGSPSQLSSNLQNLKPFAQVFESRFAPEIFKAYLRQIELYIQSLQSSDISQQAQHWISQRCTKFVIDFFDECVKPKSTWNLMRPHLPLLLQHFIFPLLCPTDEEIDEFTNDPVEYTRAHASEIILDYYTRPETSAFSLLETLTACRKKSTLGPLLSFANDIVSGYPEKRSAKEKEGALKMLGHLSNHIVNSKEFGAQMEDFFLHYVLPEFKSPHGFLRARACQMTEVFERNDMKWSEPGNINLFFEAVTQAMVDPELPVRVQAALALPELIRYEQRGYLPYREIESNNKASESVRTLVAPNIGRIMQELLKLSNETDLDVMADTTRKLVEDFSEELIPFAESLCEQLSGSFLRIMREQLDASANNAEDDPALEEKTLAAMGILKTIQQLAMSVSTSKDILAKLERIILPALIFTLQQEFNELYDELFEIINTLTFYQKSISQPMWQVFELMHQSFKSQGIDYLDEMISSFDNFISYGPQAIASNPPLLDMLIDIFQTSMTSEALGAEDRNSACKLAESMFLNLRGLIDRAVPIILDRCLDIITRKNVEDEPIITSSLYLHALELLIHGIYYSPTLTLSFLEAHNVTLIFFQKWFKKLSSLTRVHDRKLGIMAIISLLEAFPVLPQHAKEAASHFLSGALQMFEGFKEAMSERIALQDEYEVDDDDDDDAESAEEQIDDKPDQEAVDVDDDEDFTESDADFEGLLQQKIAEKMAKAGVTQVEDLDDAESEVSESWNEEILFETPLDNIDVFVEFSNAMQNMERQQPELFLHLTSNLSDSMKGQLMSIAAQAQNGGEKTLVREPVKPKKATNGF